MRRNYKLNWRAVCLGLLLALVGLSLDGCPMLLVPSLAYQGYKYEKKRSTKSTTTSTTSGGHKNSSANQPANDTSIE
jgi:hypothetical protein